MKPKIPPAYTQIEQQLMDFLERGNFAYGDKIPTEHKLMESFSVSRTTIRRSLQLLEAKGVVSRVRGSGTFYALKQSEPRLANSPRTLGMVNFFFMDYIYTEIMRGIESEATRAGYSLFVANSNGSEERQFEAIRNLINQNVDGLIIEPKKNIAAEPVDPLVQLLNNTNIPIVTTHWGIAAKQFSTVTLDDVYGGRMAGEYLMRMGHERIAFIYKQDVQASYDRLAGLRLALKDADRELNEQYVLSYSHDDETDNILQGYILTLKLLQTCSPAPSAIFYFNDNIAIQGYRALAEMSIRVPEDISVIGFDDHNTSALVSPPLTTVEHPKYDLGRWAAKVLIDEIEFSPTALPMKLQFEPKLIIRGSVKQQG